MHVARATSSHDAHDGYITNSAEGRSVAEIVNYRESLLFYCLLFKVSPCEDERLCRRLEE